LITEGRILYHGTTYKFDKVDLSKARGFKDFGRGFYLATDFGQAEKWAKRANAKYVYVYCYRIGNIEDKFLKTYELPKYNQEWLDFIADNRINGKNPDYDIIYGKVADNKGEVLSTVIRDYSKGRIPAKEALDKIRFRKDKFDQYCFRTEKAIRVLYREKIYVWKRNGRGEWDLV